MTTTQKLNCPVCSGESSFEMRFDFADVYRCKVCTHAFSTSIQIKPEEIYGVDYIEKTHKNWFQNPDFRLFKKIKKEIGKNFKNKKSISILDVGCGNGNFLRFLENAGYSDLSGIDFVENSKKETSSINYFSGDFTKFQFSRQYDVVVSMMNIEHVADPHLYISAMLTAMKPNGLIIINTIDDSSMLYKFSHLFYKLKIKALAKRLFDPHHINHFNRTSLQKLCLKYGLAVEKTFVKNYPLKATDLPGGKLGRALLLPPLTVINSLSKVMGSPISQTLFLKSIKNN